MESLEQDLLDDINAQKIQNLEQELHMTQELLHNAIDSLKQTQRYLMKLAYNQSEISRRVASWPYIVVSSDGGNDEDSN